MKGGLVTHLLALDALARPGLRLRGDVTVAATIGEEDGGLGALSTILRGYRADAALITEPTRLALVTAQGGSLVFRLTVPGRVGPRRRPRRRRLGAGEVRAHLRRICRSSSASATPPCSHPLYDGLTNKVPDQRRRRQGRRLGLDRPRVARRRGAGRPDPRRGHGAFKEQVADAIAAAAERDPWLREHPPDAGVVRRPVRPGRGRPPTPRSARPSPRPTQRVTGEPPSVEGVPYGADMRLFIRFGGMPCVMYGAGDVNVAHAPDEHVASPTF